MFKLGKMVTDKASGTKGCLTHMQIEGGQSNQVRWYMFQPAKLHTEDGTPADKCWITEDRVQGETCADEDYPIAALGTEAHDEITGFKGVVTSIVVHMNGCIHLSLQPKGTHPKTGKVLAAHEFDMRVLRGPAIPKLTETQREESQRRTPSPIECERYSPRAT
jgi:hypothetical protein